MATRPSLDEALRNAHVEPASPGMAAEAEALLRARILSSISKALVEARVGALLVKGAGLARTVYRDGAARTMGDIDLLVRAPDLAIMVDALVRRGGVVAELEDRDESAVFLAETVLQMPAGGLSYTVEVHPSLDKIVRHPIDLEGVFARATPLDDLPGLAVLSAEDHVLFVALHAATHQFCHEVAWLDLELLFRRGIDLERLAERASSWGLVAVMYAALQGLLARGAASVDATILARFDPGPLRRAVLDHVIAAARPQTTGLPWLVQQLAFHDAPSAWVRDVVRYAAARAKERARAAWRRRSS